MDSWTWVYLTLMASAAQAVSSSMAAISVRPGVRPGVIPNVVLDMRCSPPSTGNPVAHYAMDRRAAESAKVEPMAKCAASAQAPSPEP